MASPVDSCRLLLTSTAQQSACRVWLIHLQSSSAHTVRGKGHLTSGFEHVMDSGDQESGKFAEKVQLTSAPSHPGPPLGSLSLSTRNKKKIVEVNFLCKSNTRLRIPTGCRVTTISATWWFSVHFHAAPILDLALRLNHWISLASCPGKASITVSALLTESQGSPAMSVFTSLLAGSLKGRATV